MRQSLLHHNRLHVDELANAVYAQLAAVTRILYAAERQAWIGSHHTVDEYHSGLDLVHELLLLGFVIGPGAGAQPEVGIVGQPDRVIDSLGAQQYGNWAEHLFGVGRRALLDIGQHSWSVVVSRTIELTSSRQHPRALGDRA